MNIKSKSVPTGEEGLLIDPADWDEDVAQVIAQQDGLDLTDMHRAILDFIRNHYDERGIAVDAHFVITYLDNDLGLDGQGRATLYTLFPYGDMQQICKIAGMRRPRSWSTG